MSALDDMISEVRTNPQVDLSARVKAPIAVAELAKLRAQLSASEATVERVKGLAAKWANQYPVGPLLHYVELRAALASSTQEGEDV